MPQSPASDLYSTMRHIVADPNIKSVGGFVCVLSNRPNGFRHSVYSDMLYNWPETEAEDFVLRLSHQIDFGASGENADYAIAQFSTGFMGMNLVAFYVLKARKLFLYYGRENGLADKCYVISDVAPIDITQKIYEFMQIDLRWLLMVTAAASVSTKTASRSPVLTEGVPGVGLQFLCHVNTFLHTNKN